MAQSTQLIQSPAQNLSIGPALSPLKSINKLKNRVMKSMFYFSQSVLALVFFHRLVDIYSPFRFNKVRRKHIT